MKASIVIPAWNGRAYLPACLDALLAQDAGPFEIIVVDNASADGSADLVAERYPQVKLIRHERNLGFAGGCNAGLRAAKGDVLMLLNQDTQVRPDWLVALAKAFEASAGIGVVGCKALYPETRKVQHAGGWVEWPLAIARHFGYGEIDQGQWDTPRAVEFVTGAAMALRRAVLERVGLLDELFWPGYFEDIDYCWRATAAGFGVWYWPEAVVWHNESPSTNPAERSCYYQHGRLRFVLKHMPPARFLAEFLPAEQAAQTAAIGGGESRGLRLAYLRVMLDSSIILRQCWLADGVMVQTVLQALQQLYHHACQTDFEVLGSREAAALPILQSEGPPVNLGPNTLNNLFLTGAPDLLPEYVQMLQSRRTAAPSQDASWLDFQEYQFSSSLPFIGKWLARVRGWWYGLTARWAVLYFMQQQEAINRRQEAYRRVIGQRLLDLADEHSFLAARLAELLALSHDGHKQP